MRANTHAIRRERNVPRLRRQDEIRQWNKMERGWMNASTRESEKDEYTARARARPLALRGEETKRREWEGWIHEWTVRDKDRPNEWDKYRTIRRARTRRKPLLPPRGPPFSLSFSAFFSLYIYIYIYTQFTLYRYRYIDDSVHAVVSCRIGQLPPAGVWILIISFFFTSAGHGWIKVYTFRIVTPEICHFQGIFVVTLQPLISHMSF